jgi:hypothetical protein
MYYQDQIMDSRFFFGFSSLLPLLLWHLASGEARGLRPSQSQVPVRFAPQSGGHSPSGLAKPDAREKCSGLALPDAREARKERSPRSMAERFKP